MKTKVDTKDRYVIIMAGGRGERFWPLSREKTPKQLLTLLGGRSFLQQAVDRVLTLVPIKNIFVITNEAQAPEVVNRYVEAGMCSPLKTRRAELLLLRNSALGK